MMAVSLKTLQLVKYPGLRVISSEYSIDEKFIHQLFAMFTCWHGKSGELSSRASKMLPTKQVLSEEEVSQIQMSIKTLVKFSQFKIL